MKSQLQMFRNVECWDYASLHPSQCSLDKRSAIQDNLNPTTIMTIEPKVSLICICDAPHWMTQSPDGASLVQATRVTFDGALSA